KDERTIETQREPEGRPPPGRRHHQNALPHRLVDRRFIPGNERPPLPDAGHRTPPPTRPKSPISVTPPPSSRRLRGRSYPRSLASELDVRVSSHTAQAWSNAPRYPVRASIRDTVSTQSPCWHELVCGNWGGQERGSLSRCFHPSLCSRCGGYASP